MAYPFFYFPSFNLIDKNIQLDEDTSKHIIQVLRMKKGELLNLTDGKGNLFTCEITDDHKKHSVVAVKSKIQKSKSKKSITIAISLIKNSTRFEWFLEKATEIGVTEIIPLICERTEKEKFRFDRMQGICISAMLQSQQVWLPVLHEPTSFNKYIAKQSDDEKCFIAHCENDVKQQLLKYQIDKLSNCQICIGPEGDFTKEEIELAIKKEFLPVSLGETRLRTETAGVAAAALLCLIR